MAKDKEEISRDSWQKALQDLTGEHEGDVVTIEVEDLEIGDQFPAEQIPFNYIEYDPHDDAVSVGVGALDGRYPVLLRHVVEHPDHVFVHRSEEGAVTVEVRSPDGTATLVTLQGRLELPA
jgi:hypothetical protein